MKKLKLLLSLSILFFTFYACNEQLEVSNLESLDSKAAIIKPFESLSQDISINYCGEPVECTLIAGQSIDAGTVTIMNDEVNLYVKVYSKAGFQDTPENIKMWIGTELPDKRPPAGQFPYKVTESGDTHIFQIPLSSLGDIWDGECGENSDSFYIIVHADVLTESGSSETAFGGCIEAEGKGAWWYYMEYAVECCDEEEETTLGWYYKTTNNGFWATCINDNGDYGFSNELHIEWLRNKTTGTFDNGEEKIVHFPIYSNSVEDCDLANREVLGEVGLRIETDTDGEDIIKFYIKTIEAYSNVVYNIYIDWDEPVLVGDVLDPSAIFESGDLPNDTNIDPETLIFETKVSDWNGTIPDVEDKPFFVIVKLTQIN